MANPYGKTNKALIREWAESKLKRGELYTRSQLIDWFMSDYPKLTSKSSITTDFDVLSVNHPSRHHHKIKRGTRHDLFYRESSKEIKLWEPETDPEPNYVDGAPRNFTDEPEEEYDLEDVLSSELDVREKDLQNFLVKNLSQIEPGLRLFERDGMPGNEYPAGGGRRIDILALDAEDTFVVVELKVVRGYDRVIGQLQRYMAWVDKNLAEGSPTRGIIIAPEITEDLRLATSFLSDRVKLLEYSLSFEIRDATIENTEVDQ